MGSSIADLLKEQQPILFASRYFNAVALTIILYDHLCTLPQEVRFMWRRSSQESWIHRTNYFITRYTTEGIMIFVSYVASGINELDNEMCKLYVWLFTMVASVFLVSLQVTVVLRVYTIWDRRRVISLLLGIAFVVISVAIVVLAVYAARAASAGMMYISFLRNCGAPAGSSEALTYLRALLSCMTLFDLIIIALAFANALEIPHTSQTDMARSLQRDGAMIFFVLFLLRLSALLLAAVGRDTIAYILLPFIWSLISVSNSRITLRVAKSRSKSDEFDDGASSYDLHDISEAKKQKHATPTPTLDITRNPTISWGSI